MKKMARLLYELSLIQCSPGIRIDRLADKCGVSKRTIYRDLNDIAAANFPIYYDRGYKILNTAVLPPLNLTREELINIYAVLRNVAAEGAFGPVIKRVIDKLRRIIPGPAKSYGIFFKQISTDPPSINKYFESIDLAQTTNKVISIEYTSLDGRAGRRNVHPYGLVFLNHGWYLIGYCETRRDIRTFRLARISKIRILGRKFEKPADFALSDYLSDSWQVFRGPLRHIRVKFKGTAMTAVMTTRHHPSEKKKRHRGFVIYEAAARGDDDIINWVLSFGNNAELLEPEELREKLKARLKETIELYSS